MSQEKKAGGSEPAEKVPSPQPTPVLPEKAPEGAVEGVVATATGPLAQAVVSFGDRKAITDFGGRFVLEHLPVGEIALQVTPPTPRYGSSTQKAMVNAEKKGSLYIFLTESTGSIDGIVTDEMGNPLADAYVTGLFRTPEQTVTAKVGEKRRYSFNDVPPGAHFIRAHAPGFMTGGATVEVVGGKPVTHNFALTPGSLSLTGRVLDPEGIGVESEVYLMTKGIVVTKVLTKPGEGSYAFNDLVQADYELTVVAQGYSPKGWMGRLEKSEAVEFRLERQRQQEFLQDPTTAAR